MGQLIFICCSTYFTSHRNLLSFEFLCPVYRWGNQGLEWRACVTQLVVAEPIHMCEPFPLHLTPPLSTCSRGFCRPCHSPEGEHGLGAGLTGHAWCYWQRRCATSLLFRDLCGWEQDFRGWGHTIKMDPVLPFEMCGLKGIREWSVFSGLWF